MRDLPALRKKIEVYLRQFGAQQEPMALLGGDDLPETTVFEATVMAFPGRRVVHLDGSGPLTSEEVQQKILESFAAGRMLLVTLTRSVGLEVFKPLEKFLAEGQLEIQRAWGWEKHEPKDGHVCLIHSRPGSFPFDENVSLRLNLDAD